MTEGWSVVVETVHGRVLFAAVASVGLLLGASPAIAAGATWSPPVDVSAPLQFAYSVDVTVDSTGRATAIWVGQRSDDSQVIQSSTSLNGAAWTAPVDVSVPARNAPTSTPQVTVDSTGRAIAVWARSNGSNDIIQSSTSLNGGAWSPAVDLSAPLQNATDPQVTVDSTGRAIAVWKRSNGTDDIIQSSTSINGGAWTPSVDLSIQHAMSPQVTVDSTGRATAVWAPNGSNSAIQVRTSVNGAAWTPAIGLTAAIANAGDPRVVADSTGVTTAIWISYTGQNPRVQSSSSRNGGAWTTPIDVSAPDADVSGPMMTVDSTGRATAVWTRTISNGLPFPLRSFRNVIQSSTSLTGGVWTPPIDVSASDGDAVNPHVTADSTGRATVVWTRPASPSSGLAVQSSTSLKGAAWSNPVDLSAGNADTVSVDLAPPRVTADSAGRAIAVWIRYKGTKAFVQSSSVSYSSASASGGAQPAASPAPVSAGAQTTATGVNLGLPLGLAAGLLLACSAIVVAVVVRRRRRKAQTLTLDGR
jgi:hypothetical protein